MNMPDLKEARKRTDKKVNYIEANITKNPNFFNGKKYFLRTYGCQMNEHDSELVRNLVEGIGFLPCDNIEGADLVILNTCAIRENAHDKVFGFLGRCKHEKETNNPNLIICICGCMAQEPSVCEEILKKHKYVDLVFGTHNMHELPNYLMNKMDKTDFEVESIEGDVVENLEYTRDSKISAWVNIMYGCDKFCTYCIVPYTRGKQRSRFMDRILKEVKDLKDKGYKEITLLGQNVNAYGKDLKEDVTFAKLLEETAKIGIERVRFVTSHPWDFSDEMIDVISKYPNIMPYIHLPLQSGSTKILKSMGRKYTKEEYIDLYNKIKAKIPNVAITTDIIVGFPGETEEDFNETLDVVNKCKYDGAYTFAYSKRVGTPAALFKNQIDEDTQMERLHRLNEIVNKYSLDANQKLVGSVVDVLVTKQSNKEGMLSGYTKTMKLVNLKGNKDLIGQIIDVKIKIAKSFSLDGEVYVDNKNN